MRETETERVCVCVLVCVCVCARARVSVCRRGDGSEPSLLRSCLTSVPLCSVFVA